MAPPLTPLGVRASAAASMLAEGVPPEDIGAAAGLANPEGGAWDAPSLARLVDAVATRLEGRASAAAREAAGASRARWAGEAATLSDAPPPWWDPEALGALACALHASDGRGVAGGPGPALRASDLASIADVLATDLGWRDDDAADLLWCVHTASPHHAGPRDRIDQARVERAAEIALALRHDHAWSVRRCAVALARLLPAPDWDRGGLAGMRAVEGCALLAAALRAGGERGTKNDGGHRSDAGGSSSWWGSDEEEEGTRARAGTTREGEDEDGVCSLSEFAMVLNAAGWVRDAMGCDANGIEYRVVSRGRGAVEDARTDAYFRARARFVFRAGHGRGGTDERGRDCETTRTFAR